MSNLSLIADYSLKLVVAHWEVVEHSFLCVQHRMLDLLRSMMAISVNNFPYLNKFEIRNPSFLRSPLIKWELNQDLISSNLSLITNYSLKLTTAHREVVERSFVGVQHRTLDLLRSTMAISVNNFPYLVKFEIQILTFFSGPLIKQGLNLYLIRSNQSLMGE